jgi:hypothetical protein
MGQSCGRCSLGRLEWDGTFTKRAAQAEGIVLGQRQTVRLRWSGGSAGNRAAEGEGTEKVRDPDERMLKFGHLITRGHMLAIEVCSPTPHVEAFLWLLNLRRPGPEL